MPACYVCRWHIRAVAAITSLLFTALTVFFLVVLLRDGEHLALAALFFFFAALSLFLLYWTGRRVEIDKEGIRMRSWFGRGTSLEWLSIATIRGGTFNPGLRLTDLSGRRKIGLDPYLDGYEGLVEVIRAVRPDLFERADLTKLRRNPLAPALGVVAGLASIAFGIGAMRESITNGAFLAALGATVLFLTLRIPQEIRMESRTLRLKYLVGERVLDAVDIAEIVLVARRGIRGEVGESVILVLRKGKRIELAGFAMGAPIVASVLRSWWERVTAEL